MDYKNKLADLKTDIVRLSGKYDVAQNNQRFYHNLLKMVTYIGGSLTLGSMGYDFLDGELGEKLPVALTYAGVLGSFISSVVSGFSQKKNVGRSIYSFEKDLSDLVSENYSTSKEVCKNE